MIQQHSCNYYHYILDLTRSGNKQILEMTKQLLPPSGPVKAEEDQAGLKRHAQRPEKQKAQKHDPLVL